VPGAKKTGFDGNTIILAHLIRNAAGGRAGDVLRLARTELFVPLGMRHVTLEFDASGNPEGSSQMLASARDWVRFGMLYLNDGVIADAKCLGGPGRRLLDQSRR
jgi:CubicO group peptidase (beta-lactamase class C family)